MTDEPNVTSGHHTHPKLKKEGVERKNVAHYKMMNVIAEESQEACELLGDPKLVSFELKNSNRKVTVLLYLVVVKPTKIGQVGLPRFFGVGVEVIGDGSPTVPIPPENVEQDEYACRVRSGLGLIDYEVILAHDDKK